MKIYFGGCIANYTKDSFKLIDASIISFAYKKELFTLASWVKNSKDKEVDLMIDCGAYTAWTKGVPVDLEEYGLFINDFVSRYKNLFRNIYVVSLDEIPGRKGEAVSAEENKRAPKQTWDNYLILKNEYKIDNLIPIFHEGEDFKWLHKMISVTDYIGISPSNDHPTNVRKKWLDRVFNILPKDKKTHGFAVTSVKLMEDYPWYSVDSSSWTSGFRYGRVLLPSGLMIDASNKTGLKINSCLEGISKFYPDIDIEALLNDGRYRNTICIKSFLEIEKRINNRTVKFNHTQKSLF